MKFWAAVFVWVFVAGVVSAACPVMEFVGKRGGGASPVGLLGLVAEHGVLMEGCACVWCCTYSDGRWCYVSDGQKERKDDKSEELLLSRECQQECPMLCVHGKKDRVLLYLRLSMEGYHKLRGKSSMDTTSVPPALFGRK